MGEALVGWSKQIIDAKFHLHSRAAGFRILARAFGTSMPFFQDALDGIEEAPAKEKIKKKNDDDRGNSRQKQIAELV